MTNTAKKKSLTVQECAERREKNSPVLFNLEIALEAVNNTPAKVSNRQSDFSGHIMELFMAKKELSCNQVVAAFHANGMTDVTAKKVADRLWLLAKQGKLVKGELKGVYKLAE